MKLILIAIAGLILILSTGCSSITKGRTDVVNVNISNCGEPTECSATNKKGTWDFTAPGPVTVKKSDDPLTIKCQDGEDVVTRTLAPTSGEMIWGNVLVGGGIGAAIDASTDAHLDLPDTTTLVRQSCRGKTIE